MKLIEIAPRIIKKNIFKESQVQRRQIKAFADPGNPDLHLGGLLRQQLRRLRVPLVGQPPRVGHHLLLRGLHPRRGHRQDFAGAGIAHQRKCTRQISAAVLLHISRRVQSKISVLHIIDLYSIQFNSILCFISHRAINYIIRNGSLTDQC